MLSLHRRHAMGEVALGAHDGAKFFDVLLHGAADDGVAVLPPAFHFEGGIAHANLDLFLGLGTAAQEAAAEFLQVGKNDEHIGQRIEDHRIAAGSDIGGSACVDVEQDINALFEILEHGGLQGSVVVAMNLGVFQEFAGGQSVREVFRREEMIILSIDFARTRGARRAGD